MMYFTNEQAPRQLSDRSFEKLLLLHQNNID